MISDQILFISGLYRYPAFEVPPRLVSLLPRPIPAAAVLSVGVVISPLDASRGPIDVAHHLCDIEVLNQ